MDDEPRDAEVVEILTWWRQTESWRLAMAEELARIPAETLPRIRAGLLEGTHVWVLSAVDGAQIVERVDTPETAAELLRRWDEEE